MSESNDPYVLSATEAGRLLSGAPWSRLVIVGDSVAEGVTEPYAGYDLGTWYDLVLAALRTVQPDLVHLNLGRRNLLTAEVRETQLQAALDFRPDLIVALCGGNDAFRREFDPDAVEEQLEALFEPLSATGGTLVTSGFFDIVGNPHRHDAAAALFVDGELVAAVEEGRLNREKKTPGFPMSWHLPAWSGPNRVSGGLQKATTLRTTLRSRWRSRRRGCAGRYVTIAGPGLPRSC
ncbi:GDSL-type esterase/lipase family protein [Microtetraspora malaysiensis]|uniref:SGNH/GDSL hydrolase family protein n=1 Tax=Microtetraspora malaysiensis TaxID=161358 RepID=UPI003D921307